MKNNILEISEDDFDDIIIELEDIDKILTERISDLHQIKGAMAERHSFIYYRKLICDLKDNLNKKINEKKNK